MSLKGAFWAFPDSTYILMNLRLMINGASGLGNHGVKHAGFDAWACHCEFRLLAKLGTYKPKYVRICRIVTVPWNNVYIKIPKPVSLT